MVAYGKFSFFLCVMLTKCTLYRFIHNSLAITIINNDLVYNKNLCHGFVSLSGLNLTINFWTTFQIWLLVCEFIPDNNAVSYHTFKTVLGHNIIIKKRVDMKGIELGSPSKSWFLKWNIALYCRIILIIMPYTSISTLLFQYSFLHLLRDLSKTIMTTNGIGKLMQKNST